MVTNEKGNQMVTEEESIDAGLRALSDTTRRAILALLTKGQLSVLEIAEKFPMSRPAISKHLRILKEAGLVLETPVGRQRLYSRESVPLELLQSWLAAFNGHRVPSRPSRVESRVRRVVPGRRSVPRQNDWRVW